MRTLPDDCDGIVHALVGRGDVASARNRLVTVEMPERRCRKGGELQARGWVPLGKQSGRHHRRAYSQ
eukprot:3646281-Rhodomonas_salina.2